VIGLLNFRSYQLHVCEQALEKLIWKEQGQVLTFVANIFHSFCPALFTPLRDRSAFDDAPKFTRQRRREL